MSIPHAFKPLGGFGRQQLELTSADFIRSSWSDQELNPLGRPVGPYWRFGRLCQRQEELGVLYFGYNYGRTDLFDGNSELNCGWDNKVIPPRPSDGETRFPAFECWSLDKPRKFKVELSLSRDFQGTSYAYQTNDGWQTWEPILVQKNGIDVYIETTECQSFCFGQMTNYYFKGEMKKMIVS